MDTTKKYIQMCEKAKEIQQTWECDDGDFMAAPPRTGVFNSDEKDKEWIIWTVCDYYSAASYCQKEKREDHPQAHQSYFNEYSDVFRQFDGGYEWDNELIAKRKDCIYLPRQDQLQGIAGEKDPMDLLQMFYEELYFEPEMMSEKRPSGYWLPKRCYEQFDSMEQLWLAFVMKMKHKKTWDGEKWITKK